MSHTRIYAIDFIDNKNKITWTIPIGMIPEKIKGNIIILKLLFLWKLRKMAPTQPWTYPSRKQASSKAKKIQFFF